MTSLLCVSLLSFILPVFVCFLHDLRFMHLETDSSAIECYRRSIALENVQRIADALGIETYKLFVEDSANE